MDNKEVVLETLKNLSIYIESFVLKRLNEKNLLQSTEDEMLLDESEWDPLISGLVSDQTQEYAAGLLLVNLKDKLDQIQKDRIDKRRFESLKLFLAGKVSLEFKPIVLDHKEHTNCRLVFDHLRSKIPGTSYPIKAHRPRKYLDYESVIKEIAFNNTLDPEYFNVLDWIDYLPAISLECWIELREYVLLKAKSLADGVELFLKVAKYYGLRIEEISSLFELKFDIPFDDFPAGSMEKMKGVQSILSVFWLIRDNPVAIENFLSMITPDNRWMLLLLRKYYTLDPEGQSPKRLKLA